MTGARDLVKILGASPEALKSQIQQKGFKVEASFEALDPLRIKLNKPRY